MALSESEIIEVGHLLEVEKLKLYAAERILSEWDSKIGKVLDAYAAGPKSESMHIVQYFNGAHGLGWQMFARRMATACLRRCSRVVVFRGIVGITFAIGYASWLESYQALCMLSHSATKCGFDVVQLCAEAASVCQLRGAERLQEFGSMDPVDRGIAGIKFEEYMANDGLSFRFKFHSALRFNDDGTIIL